MIPALIAAAVSMPRGRTAPLPVPLAVLVIALLAILSWGIVAAFVASIAYLVMGAW